MRDFLSFVWPVIAVVAGFIAIIWANRKNSIIPLLKEELDAVRRRADRFHGDLERERELGAEREKELLRLQGATDLSALTHMIHESFTALTELVAVNTKALEAMERRINGNEIRSSSRKEPK